MEKTKKIVFILIIAFLLVSLFNNIVYANDKKTDLIKEIDMCNKNVDSAKQELEKAKQEVENAKLNLIDVKKEIKESNIIQVEAEKMLNEANEKLRQANEKLKQANENFDKANEKLKQVNEKLNQTNNNKNDASKEYDGTKIDPGFYNPTSSEPTQEDSQKFVGKVGVILGAVRNISVVISVIALMIIGIKYIFGSVEEKANYKQTLIPYVVGAVLVVSGTTLVSFIYNAVH